MAIKKGGLGKGLDALFADNAAENGRETSTLRIADIEPNREQPRKDFDEEAMLQLAESIREHGVLQPILVRPIDTDRYQIVAGERRWRASRMAGLTEIPAVVREMTEDETMQLAMIENLQREDLNAIEEALGYKTLIDRYEMTQDEVAKRVGRSRPAVANSLRLLNLPEKTAKLVRNGDLSAGHARALLAAEDEEFINELAEKIVKTGMSVREVEKALKPKKEGTKPANAKFRFEKGELFCKEVETALTTELGRRVTVTANGEGGTLTIEFFSQQDLGDIAKKLCK